MLIELAASGQRPSCLLRCLLSPYFSFYRTALAGGPEKKFVTGLEPALSGLLLGEIF